MPERVVDANGVGHFGWPGVVTAAAVVFFAVFGYDTLTTAAEEAKNPQRDLPRAILLSLGVSMVLYITITLVLTGMVSYTQLGNEAPVAHAFQGARYEMGSARRFRRRRSRAFSASSSRSCSPRRASGLRCRATACCRAGSRKFIRRYGTPYRPTLVLGAFTALVAGLFPLGEVAKLVNIGVLSAFYRDLCGRYSCCASRKPDLPRAFRTPWVPVIPDHRYTFFGMAVIGTGIDYVDGIFGLGNARSDYLFRVRNPTQQTGVCITAPTSR